MIRLARRALLVATVSLLTSAATTYAECAWVLWSSDHGQHWVIHGTHRDKRACFKQIEREFADHHATETERADGNMHVQGSVAMYTFHCLPDTVDPRGPKVK